MTDDRDDRVREADARDREPVIRLLDAAFGNDAVSSWVLPGAEYRRRTHPMLMAACLDTVLSEGRVDLRVDGGGVALWLPVPAGGHGDGDEAALFRDAVDPGNERIETLGRLTAAVHPKERAHAYLWLIAVHPARQGRGLGGALLRSALDRYDRDGLPAYLEATSPGSRALYRRFGFMDSGPVLRLPEDGPGFWPMWREPGAG
ncbi:GNAT family N-acetyltransferase [Streptomyces sp. CAU 1734]|uniref:GNAT family N-acetyltransferase n=1 Tax=Streptomyces sp. CAU 1734 TaxID=3140360 RepID=UPI00326148A7